MRHLSGPPSSPGWLARFRKELPGSFHADAPLLGLVFAFFVGGMIVASIAGARGIVSLYLYVPTYVVFVPGMIIYLIICHVIRVIATERPKRPLTRLKEDFGAVLATPRRIASALPILLALSFFGSTFTLVKSTIPMLHPFAWDRTFEQWDRWLTGGVAPVAIAASAAGPSRPSRRCSPGFMISGFFCWPS